MNIFQLKSRFLVLVISLFIAQSVTAEYINVPGGVYSEGDVRLQGLDVIIDGVTIELEGDVAIGGLKLLSGGRLIKASSVTGVLDISSQTLELDVDTNLSLLGINFTVLGGMISSSSSMVLDNSIFSIQPTSIDQVTQWQSVELKNNSKVTHADSADISLGLNWQADTITVDATSSFDVSSKSSSHNGIYSGGSHAGRGAGVDSDLSYGLIDQPYTMGKAAFYSGSTYKKGGGAIRLVANELVLNGALNSDGEGYSSYNAGAGGSIWVVAETLSGIGSIHASGADSTNSRYPGAGGRVAVYANDTSNFDLSNVEAKGGLNTNSPTNPIYAGGAGTVYLKNTSTNKTDLVLSSQLH
jgi:hypothetical protein